MTWCEVGVLAITGENRIGKSTLLPMIAGLLESDQGRIYINEQEQSASNDEYKKLVAYVPDKSRVYDFIQGAEFLNLICSIRKLSADAYCKFISWFKLEEYLDIPFAQMSFGTTKKFLLIAAWGN
ncbi:ABC transporter ATP-binding protein [Acinetobacter gandensis]|uniref:ABC transporter ATP-binding protein n=1 Tax=Acinetobacter gandensis TaxID=1443941 RepID=UPI0039895DF3